MSHARVWDDHLARVGAELLGARLRLVDDLRPYVGKAYEAVARGASRDDADLDYQASVDLPASRRDRDALRRARCSPRSPRGARTSSTAASRWSVRTATSCCSPSATRGCACRSRATPRHGESWSFALALRLASYDLLRADGDDPILVLDDVFAELDAERAQQLAELVAGAEQVLVTAAVAADVPAALQGVRYRGRGRAGDP